MRLTIHIGAFKTATSAAQLSFVQGRWPLRRAGVKYAETGRNASLGKHLHLFDHIVDCEANHDRHVKHANVDYLGGLRAELGQRFVRRLLLSEEELSTPDPAIAHFFAPLREVAAVDVVLVVRAQPAFMESLYLQFMSEARRRLASTFDEFWRDPDIAAYGDFAGVVAPWAEVFGDDAVTVLDFDELRRGGAAVAGLCSAMGLPPRIAIDGEVNPSISPVTAEVLRRLALVDPTIARKPLLEHLREQDVSPGTTIVDELTSQEIQRHFADSNRALRERFGVDLSRSAQSGREVLSPEALESRALRLSAELIDALWRRGRRVFDPQAGSPIPSDG